ncbi:hypothetical protein [Paenibacillus wynnii]|uniref:hypothetical protein n=1 Tax=Paenibacillus wynnii TaxID=268407 RepID=UPI0027935C36|nr:hypothetical protein [Paenibacillus wynnii]MDQ0194712.1 outer membrane biosynthesis protein TonB [Paenibacillus wynnii]
MAFNPETNDELVIDGKVYAVQGHPFFIEIPYGQEGRQGTVYKLTSVQDGLSKALKVFKPAFRQPSNVYLSEQLAVFSKIEGLQVCERSVLIPQRDMELLGTHSELLYAVLMPWINGPTWMDIMLDKRDFTKDTALHTAKSLAEVLSFMEQRGLAHGDLSGSNVMIPGLLHEITPLVKSWIQLIDMEQMFAVQLDRPEYLATGSPGYSSRRSEYQHLWNKYADRYSGSILLAEMLVWFHPEIREAAWGESYFDPERMEEDHDRVVLINKVLVETYGNEVARLFRKAWNSDALYQCPAFGEWFIALSSVSFKNIVIPEIPAGNVVDSEALLPLHHPVPAEVLPEWSEAGLSRARMLESEGDLNGALAAYTALLASPLVNSAVRYEIEAAAAVIQSLIAKQQLQVVTPESEEPPVRRKWRAGIIVALASAILLGGGLTVRGMMRDSDSKEPLMNAVAQTSEPTPSETVNAVSAVDQVIAEETATPQPALPSSQPTATLVAKPTIQPTAKLSVKPSKKPTAPTTKPTAKPTVKPTKKPTATKSVATVKPISKDQKIKALEDSIFNAYNVEDDTEKVIRLSKQLKALDSHNSLALRMLRELTGE